MNALTRRQQQVFSAIVDSIQRRGYPPTLREISSVVGLRQNSGSVSHYLRALSAKGYIRVEPGLARAITVLHTPSSPAALAAPPNSPSVDVAAIASLTDRFRCVPLAATLSAAACTLRQEGAREDRAPYPRGSAKERFQACRSCPLGERVLARLKLAGVA